MWSPWGLGDGEHFNFQSLDFADRKQLFFETKKQLNLVLGGLVFGEIERVFPASYEKQLIEGPRY